MTTFKTGDGIRRTKTEMLQGTDAIKARKIANNTIEYHQENGDRVIRLHLTDILIFTPDGRTIFNSGGWRTLITKNRLNEYQDKIFIYQHRSIWYCSPDAYPWTSSGKHPIFYDGMTLDPEGNIIDPKTTDPETKKLLKQIREYCQELNKLEILPADPSEDCFFCHFRTDQDNEPLGDATKNRDHLKTHLKEKYFMFSLNYNALKANGHLDAYFIMEIEKDPGQRTRLINAVRRYFKKQLGLAN